MTTATAPSTTLVTMARVRRAERLSPAFVRVTLESPDFADLARDVGFDTRFKMIFPRDDGVLPELGAVGADWYLCWLGMPPQQRAPMRTYTIRDVVDEGPDVLLVVDLVVHEPVHEAGPACRWAAGARSGDVVQVVAPRRDLAQHGLAYGGFEFDPGGHRRLLIAADETAVPAVARILLDLQPGAVGDVFCEVPRREDMLPLSVPPGIRLHWLPRSDWKPSRGRAQGRALVDAVREHQGLGGVEPVAASAATPGDIDVWETPRYSASGEDIMGSGPAPLSGDLYAWIAGESWAVKALRRLVVRELNVDRTDVAFMGYWREGVAMKS